MGIVTKIEYQKNKTRVNIYVDGEFFCGLNSEVLFSNQIKVGSEVDEQRLKALIFESEVKKGVSYVFGLLAKRPYAEREIRTKLYQKGYSSETAQKIIETIKEYKLIDDSDYAKTYVDSKKKKKKREIEFNLSQKGIDKHIIQNAVNDIENDDEMAKIDIITAKYMKNKPKTSENLQKLFRYLQGKGFEFELIKNKISKLKEQVNDESWDWFSKCCTV